MSETVVLFDGTTAILSYSFHMWRTSVGGRDYCSHKKDILLRCLSECYGSIIPEVEPEPVLPLAEILFKQLKSAKLEQKQDARRRLLQLAESGDEDAIKYLGKLPEKKISLQAKYLAKSLGKSFYDVTFYDLSQHVTDIVLREKLMGEITKLFEMK